MVSNYAILVLKALGSHSEMFSYCAHSSSCHVCAPVSSLDHCASSVAHPSVVLLIGGGFLGRLKQRDPSLWHLVSVLKAHVLALHALCCRFRRLRRTYLHSMGLQSIALALKTLVGFVVVV